MGVCDGVALGVGVDVGTSVYVGTTVGEGVTVGNWISDTGCPLSPSDGGVIVAVGVGVALGTAVAVAVRDGVADGGIGMSVLGSIPGGTTITPGV